jgi:hypothetical protein
MMPQADTAPAKQSADTADLMPLTPTLDPNPPLLLTKN